MTKSATAGTGSSLLGPVVDVASPLGFAATPTFALIAWISATGSPGLTMCFSPLVPINDMALMYLLMSLFHLSPWLKLLFHRFAASHHPTQIEGD